MEIKIDCVDVIDVENYIVISKYRLNLLFYKLGGIVVYVCNILSKFVFLIINECDYVLWIRVKKDVVYLYEDLIIGIIYILFVNFCYLFLEIFDEFEREIVIFLIVIECICLIGDFNSRVVCEKDYFDFVDFENLVLDDNIL